MDHLKGDQVSLLLVLTAWRAKTDDYDKAKRGRNVKIWVDNKNSLLKKTTPHPRLFTSLLSNMDARQKCPHTVPRLLPHPVGQKCDRGRAVLFEVAKTKPQTSAKNGANERALQWKHLTRVLKTILHWLSEWDTCRIRVKSKLQNISCYCQTSSHWPDCGRLPVPSCRVWTLFCEIRKKRFSVYSQYRMFADPVCHNTCPLAKKDLWRVEMLLIIYHRVFTDKHRFKDI